MNKEYFQTLQNQESYGKKNQIFLKKRVLKTFLKLINVFLNKDVQKNSFILDLGTADGTFVEVVENNGFKSLGLDINEINLETDKIDLENETCDVITANSLIEHIKNPDNLMKESKRLLKKDGVLILVTPDWAQNFKNFYDDPTHVKPYTKKSLEFLLKSYGFENVKIVPWLVCKPTWMWKNPFNFLLARLIPFRGNSGRLIPGFLKGKSKTLLAICSKS